MSAVLEEHIWAGRNYFEPVVAGVRDHVFDQSHRSARSTDARWGFRVVGANQFGTADGENKFGNAFNAVDPRSISARFSAISVSKRIP